MLCLKKGFEFQLVSYSGLLTFLLFQINYILRHPPPMAMTDGSSQTLPCNGLYLVIIKAGDFIPLLYRAGRPGGRSHVY